MGQGDGGLPLEQLKLLRKLIERVGRVTPDVWFDEALDALRSLVAVERAAILLFDDSGVMRFRAWRGLSSQYRARVEGHSPWSERTEDPEPVLVPDVMREPSLSEFRAAFEAEHIGALAFVPLASGERLLGKFMLYYAEPHAFRDQEVELARVLAGHVAFAVDKSRAERELRSSSEELGVILRSVNDAIAVQDPNGEFRYGNDAAAALFGFESVTELLGAESDHVGSRFQALDDHGLPLPPEEMPLQTALATGREVSQRLRLREAGGGGERYLLTTSVPVFSDAGNVRFVVHVLRDVTDRVRAEERAARAADRMDRLQRFTATIGHALTLEEVARTAVGHGRAALGASAGVVYHLSKSEDHLELIAVSGYDEPLLDTVRTLDLGRSTPVTDAIREGQPVLLRDLEERHRAYPDLARPGVVEGAIAAVPIGRYAALGLQFPDARAFTAEDRDFFQALTGQCAQAFERAVLYEAEREARAVAEEAREQAREAERRKDEFLAMLGHELRNPLAPIVTALELMRLSSDNRAAFPKERAIIDRHVRYLLRLVDDLLDISRITRGKLRLKRELLEIREIVGDAIEITSPLIEERNHRLEVAVPDTGLRVNGDRVRLAQVVSNLLSNSARYTNPGGHISVSAGRLGDLIVLAVEDDGAGIDPSAVPRLFELFEQGGPRPDGIGGLGLGLTIVRNLVQMHGGEIVVHSRGVGHGSRFEVRLPAAVERRRASESQRMRAVSQPPPVSNRRVLIVDDNKDAADLLAVALEHVGYQTATAEDGPSALELAARFEPDIALLDIGLPVMDGYQLARRLREGPGGPSLRLVALTGYGQEKDRQRAREAGFDAHFVKPVPLEAVIEALARLEHSLPAEAAAPGTPD